MHEHARTRTHSLTHSLMVLDGRVDQGEGLIEDVSFFLSLTLTKDVNTLQNISLLGIFIINNIFAIGITQLILVTIKFPVLECGISRCFPIPVSPTPVCGAWLGQR